MLSSLLPGLREVRAPLSSGFVWLVSLWFLFEPRWGRIDHEGGWISSAGRLMGTLDIVGQGAVLSFAAYLLGSFSVFVFSRPLLSLVEMSLDGPSRRLDGLSDLARESLAQVAVDGRQRLEQALTLSGVGVDKVLGIAAPRPSAGDKSMPARTSRRGRLVAHRLTSATVLPTPEQRQERELATRVLRDLPVVANAQLLGQQPEVFSAVDRSQAEVDFRAAIVPSVVALSFSVALAQRNVVAAAAAVLVGALSAIGLMLDAARQRREANELILSLMEHGRIDPPSLLRAESVATSLADQAPAKVVARQGEAAARAIRQYFASLEAVPSSGSLPMLTQAGEASQRAHEEVTRLDRYVLQHGPYPVPAVPGDLVLQPLDRVLSGWAELNAGLNLSDSIPPVAWPAGRPSPEELLHLLREARERNDEFVEGVRGVVSHIAAQDAARSSVPDAR